VVNNLTVAESTGIADFIATSLQTANIRLAKENFCQTQNGCAV
jgi:hypothetical protein